MKLDSSDRLSSFFSRQKLLTFRKGEIILMPDETPRGIFFIREGHVRVYSLTEWGDEKLFVIYKQQEIFPLFWVFDKNPIKRFYEAMDDVELLCAPTEDFLSYIKSNPDSLMEFTYKIAGIFYVCLDRIDTLEYINAYPRLIARLLYLTKRFGEKRGNKLLISIPLTHKDIATSISMTRETVSRELEKLEKKNLIKYVNHQIVVNDIKKLEAELSAFHDKKLL